MYVWKTTQSRYCRIFYGGNWNCFDVPLNCSLMQNTAIVSDKRDCHHKICAA